MSEVENLTQQNKMLQAQCAGMKTILSAREQDIVILHTNLKLHETYAKELNQAMTDHKKKVEKLENECATLKAENESLKANVPQEDAA